MPASVPKPNTLWQEKRCPSRKAVSHGVTNLIGVDGVTIIIVFVYTEDPETIYALPEYKFGERFEHYESNT